MTRPSIPRQLLLAGAALLAFALFAACGDDDDPVTGSTPGEPTGTPTRASEPGPTTPTNPDLARIQPAIDALTSGDATRIRALIAFTPVPCKDHVQGFPQPPACDLQPQGTKVDVFPASSCEGAYLVPGAVGQLLSGVRPSHLSGAFKKNGPETNAEYPDGRYGVILAAKDGSGMGSYWGLDDAGHIVRYWHGLRLDAGADCRGAAERRELGSRAVVSRAPTRPQGPKPGPTGLRRSPGARHARLAA